METAGDHIGYVIASSMAAPETGVTEPAHAGRAPCNLERYWVGLPWVTLCLQFKLLWEGTGE